MSGAPDPTTSVRDGRFRAIANEGGNFRLSKPQIDIVDTMAPSSMSDQADNTTHDLSRHGVNPPDETVEVLDDYPPVISEFTNEQIAYTDSLLPPTSFQPLFTLVTDSRTTEVHHPSIYYVFADDAENEREGNDVATIAALTALGNNEDNTLTDQQSPEVEERFILLDMQPSETDDGFGLRVDQAASLTPAWAITSATMRHAPTLDDEDQQDGAVMLMLEGTELGSTNDKKIGPSDNVRRSGKRTEHRGSNLFEDARKRANGNVIDSMSDLYKQLDDGFAIVNTVTQASQGLPDAR